MTGGCGGVDLSGLNIADIDIKGTSLVTTNSYAMISAEIEINFDINTNDNDDLDSYDVTLDASITAMPEGSQAEVTTVGTYREYYIFLPTDQAGQYEITLTATLNASYEETVQTSTKTKVYTLETFAPDENEEKLEIAETFDSFTDISEEISSSDFEMAYTSYHTSGPFSKSDSHIFSSTQDSLVVVSYSQEEVDNPYSSYIVIEIDGTPYRTPFYAPFLTPDTDELILDLYSFGSILVEDMDSDGLDEIYFSCPFAGAVKIVKLQLVTT